MSKIIPIWENGQCSPDSPNKVFCTAPWVHTYISPQSERRLCCASRETHSFQKQYIDASNDQKYGEVTESKTALSDYNPVSLNEHWNSEYMKDIRKKLMAGERIPQCDVCNDDILSISSYRKWFTGFLFNDKIQQCFDNTDETGYTTMEPISFDYRYSNLCNFKCRMCGEQLSSSWEVEKKQHFLWNPKDQPFMIPEVKTAMQSFQQDVVEPEFRDAISRGIVEEIYWVGGEPLMYEMHWWALEEMVRNGSAKNCYLRYNSNLSRVSYKGKNLYDYLPHFKDWMMCASMDGVGEIAEFIRTGLNWATWIDNFKQGTTLPGGHEKMILDLTITGPGMFSLKELFDLSQELDVRIETKIMFAFHADIMFTPMAWPRAILDEMINDLLACMEPKAAHKQMSLINTLKSMKTRQTHEEAYPNEFKQGAKNGKGWQSKLAEIREASCTIEDIYAENPKLLEWWNNI
jgi:hypothetical protein